MKIALWARHHGLIDMMYGVLKNHDVRLQEKFEGHPIHQGDEDVIISTFAYDFLLKYNGTKPLILYATDPVPLATLKTFRDIQLNSKVTVVVSEKCYPQEVCPIIVPYTEIPFALDPTQYPKYTGEINSVLVVNRKPEDRWDEVIRGVTGLGHPLEQYLEGIPFDICRIPSKEQYRKTLAKYKVMFYFSNSPYTIVMFEGMTIGMPMIGFNHSNVTATKPIEKYLHNYSTDREVILKMLKEKLDQPAQPETYNFVPFDEIVQRWDKVLEVAYAKR